MSDESNELAKKLLRDFGTLQNNRGNFDSQWKEVAERVIPDDAPLFESRGNDFTQGDKRTSQLFDATAMVALGRFASIMDSILTPRNQQYHSITTKNPILKRNRQARLWFDDVTEVLFSYRYAPAANFASQNLLTWSSLGGYGNGALFVDALSTGTGTRYKNTHLSEIYFRENHQGLVDSVYRYFNLTVRQAITQFGDKLPKSIRDKMANSPDDKFKFLHCVEPRELYDPKRLDSKNMPFASYYVSEEGQVLLSEGGFRTFPYAISRYTQVTNETYGRGPAMQVLPSIKTLNEQKLAMLKAAQRAVDPIYLAYDDGVLDTFNAAPGSMNSGGVSADGRPLIQALYPGDTRIGKEAQDDERSLINDEFMITLFQILVETPTMTATEVIERTREKGILLAPTAGRQQSEYLGPMVHREIDVLQAQGRIPPPPAIIQEAAAVGEFDYDVEYDSPLSRMQKAEGASGLLRTLETALNYANVTQDSSVLFYFNMDVAIPELSRINGVPEAWLNSSEAVEQMKQAQRQQQELQQAASLAPGAAAMVKATAAAGIKPKAS